MQNVEIFEYESHSNTDLVGAVKNKLSGKAYPDNYILLCYVHGRSGEIFKTKDIYKKVKKINLRIAEVWVLANILSPTNSEHVIFQIYPKHNAYRFDYLEECKTSKQKELIHTRRGSTQKIKFVPMGKHVLKLP